MDIDVTVLRSLEAEKDISMDLVIKAIEDALLVAYHKSDGAAPTARVEVNRNTGHVTVWASETDENGMRIREYDDTPTGFGRIAATTAGQVILQRLRDAEDELTFGEFAGQEGNIVAGVIQQGKDPKAVLVDLGRIEAILPPSEQVPGERYVHGERLKCYVVLVRKGFRGPSVTLSRTHPNLVRRLFALEVPEIASGAVEIAAIARRQCLGWVSGRSIPGEDTSSVYGASPIAFFASSRAETSRLTSAMSSRLTPPSASTMIRSTRRRPAVAILTASRSISKACSTGSIRVATRAVSGVPGALPRLPGPGRPPSRLARPSPGPPSRPAELWPRASRHVPARPPARACLGVPRRFSRITPPRRRLGPAIRALA